MSKSHSYSAKIIDSRTRELRQVDINAENDQDAAIQALRHGSVVKVKRRMGLMVGKGLTSSERYVFLSRLATMLGSRVSTGVALQLMRDTFSGSISSISHRMLRRIESGDNIAEAMEAMGEAAFPSAITALVKAGTQGGNSWKALQDAAEFELELNEIKKNSSKGMGSAIFGFLFAAGTLIGSTFYMGPKIMDSPLFRMNPNVNVDWVNDIAVVVGWIMVVFTALFLMLIFLGTVVKRILPTFADKIIMRIPYYKDLVISKNSYATLYGLSLLVRSGVRIEESLRISMETAPRGALKNDFKNAISAVKSGKPWAQAMSTLHPTDRAALMTSQDREQTGRSLDHLANQYRRLYAERLKVIIPTMQMVASLLLTITGAIVFGQVILPMLQLSTAVM